MPSLAPLRALVERGEHLVEGARAHVQDGAAAGRGLADVGEGCDRIGDHHGVGVAEQILEEVDETVLLDELGADVVQLGHGDGCCLPHVRILVPKQSLSFKFRFRYSASKAVSDTIYQVAYGYGRKSEHHTIFEGKIQEPKMKERA